jgi:uncharacterized protein YjiS (DUF1127 family)
MRDYIMTEARSRESTYSFPVLRRVVGNWLKRRQLRRLEQLDDHILMDIGLTRDELLRVQHLPLDVDPVWELMRQDRMRPRIAGRRHK